MDFQQPPTHPLRYLFREARRANPSSRYQLGDQLGSGGMSIVYAASCIRTGRKVAIKVIHLLDEDRKVQQRVADEVRLQKSLSEHPSSLFPEYIESFIYLRKLWLVMELIEGVTLTAAISSKRKHFNRKQIGAVCSQLLRAIQLLHKQCRVIHKDIKPDNIMLTADGTLKLMDLGLCQPQGKKPPQLCGTAYYMAPESLERAECLASEDVWSVGITVVEMITGSAPYTNYDQQCAMSLIAQHGAPTSIYEDSRCDSVLEAFLMSCLALEPSSRASVDELLKHELCNEETPAADTLRKLMKKIMTREQRRAHKRQHNSSSERTVKCFCW